MQIFFDYVTSNYFLSLVLMLGCGMAIGFMAASVRLRRSQD